MPPGPKPLGERALTPAERQARYRTAHAADTAAIVKVCYAGPPTGAAGPSDDATRWQN